ncbi:hypothetical protein EV194_106149 [Natronoflexus pectinivorans]|uniref:Uncharacterized protein n=1 Tax=Natronoflexus pectinivorans TaxID=682526 RepID=A0A4R2GHT9_9BACT|nr:hypothetical protein EV194_106149 [Natronoflexus pectinivorans]
MKVQNYSINLFYKPAYIFKQTLKRFDHNKMLYFYSCRSERTHNIYYADNLYIKRQITNFETN